jgi:hypothetical protein
MNQILSIVPTLIVLAAGLAALVAWVRRDRFSGANANPSGTPSREAAPSTETAVDRFLAQRPVTAVAGDRRPAPYESHATTATA